MTGFQFLNTVVGAPQRLVLDQRRLHQRIDGVGRRAQTLHDRRHRLAIARGVLQLGEPVE